MPKSLCTRWLLVSNGFYAFLIVVANGFYWLCKLIFGKSITYQYRSTSKLENYMMHLIFCIKTVTFFWRKLFQIPCEYWKQIYNFLLKKHMKWFLKLKRILWLCQSLNIVYFIPKSILTKMDNIFSWISENILFLKVYIHTFMINIF